VFDVHAPDGVFGLLVDGDVVVDDVGLESSVFVKDDVVEAVLLVVLGDEQGFVVHGGHQVDFGQEVGHLAGVFDLQRGLFLIGEEGGSVVLRIKLGESFQNNFALVGVEVLDVVLGDGPLGVFEHGFD